MECFFKDRSNQCVSGFCKVNNQLTIRFPKQFSLHKGPTRLMSEDISELITDLTVSRIQNEFLTQVHIFE